MSADEHEHEEERAFQAREVLELGEELFELALRGYEAWETTRKAGATDESSAQTPARPPEGMPEATGEIYPVEALRSAATSFFLVLRQLLAVEDDPAG